MKKIFITGGSGMLGSYTASQAVEARWETWATYSAHRVELAGCNVVQLDIRDPLAVAGAVTRIKPDVVIHTAAIAKPDLCEQDKDNCFRINTLGTHNLASAAEGIGAHFVYISTDTIFDGERNPYQVDDHPSPINHYGITKAAGEAAVQGLTTGWAIVRTSVIYGPAISPFAESSTDKIVETLSAGKPFKAFADQYRCPIPAWNLADVLLEIAERRLTGVYHASCPEVSTRLQFARKVAEIFGLDQSLVQPIYMDAVHTPARRPKMLVLDTTSTQARLHTRLLNFEEGIQGLKGKTLL